MKKNLERNKFAEATTTSTFVRSFLQLKLINDLLLVIISSSQQQQLNARLRCSSFVSKAFL